jgi:hypothetical protein
MAQVDDLSRSLVTFDQQSTLVVIVEMSQTRWLVAGTGPGLDRRPPEETGTERADAAALGEALGG